MGGLMRPIEPKPEGKPDYVSRVEFCHYVETQAAELAHMAARVGLGGLAAVLSLAVLECRQIVAETLKVPQAT